MPSVQPANVYRGRPRLLVESGVRHSLGWQDHRKAGPSFVVVRVSGLDRIKVIERFTLTEQGWAAAWRALSGLDADAAAAIGARLGQLEAGQHAAAALVAPGAGAFRRPGPVNFKGGSAGAAQCTSAGSRLRVLCGW